MATSDQPMPISTRFAPVMLAMAYALYAGSFPATQAKCRSTAYSGSTLINARAISASERGMSRSDSSAPQLRMNAAPIIAIPAMIETGIGLVSTR